MTSYTSKQKNKIKYLLSLTDDVVKNWSSEKYPKQPCFIWTKWESAQFLFPDLEGDEFLKAFYSPRAGGWYIVDMDITYSSVDNILTTLTQKACLTTWLIEERKKDFIPLLTKKSLEDTLIFKPIKSTEKAEKILQFLAKRKNPWESIIVLRSGRGMDTNNIFLFPESESEGIEEIQKILFYLESGGYIEIENTNMYHSVRLTLEGKIATEEVTNEDSDIGFIAMWFARKKDISFDEKKEMGDTMNKVWKAIENGIIKAGYKPVRIDNIEHNKQIDDEIIANIKRARFVVADFTYGNEGARGGVYYEAGFAQGLDIEVIFTCHKDMIEKIHFDTRQYNHILWTEKTDDTEYKDYNLEEFTKKIAHRISATIGDGPRKDKKP